jgi:hypothetical protein
MECFHGGFFCFSLECSAFEYSWFSNRFRHSKYPNSVIEKLKWKHFFFENIDLIAFSDTHPFTNHHHHSPICFVIKFQAYLFSIENFQVWFH